MTNRLAIINMVLLFAISSIAQNNCACIDKPNLNEIISCHTIYLQNNSILYRQFNCDSSWLVFENKIGKKLILCPIYNDMLEYTERIGPQFIREYESTLLFGDRHALASCWPYYFSLLSKTDGHIVKDFGHLIYYPYDTTYNFLLYFTDTSLNSITLNFVDLSKSIIFQLPKERIVTTMKHGGELFPEDLFKDIVLENNELIIQYKYLLPNGDYLDWEEETIKINLNQYAR